MSPSIWTRCAATFKARKIELLAHRVVESQHVLSTRKLVDSNEEQALLEELIDRTKPEVPAGPEFRGLDYLLFTPFRHPPLRYGSRFGARRERGLWYGSKELRTSLAEVSYYRLLFLEGTTAPLGTLTVELTAFVAAVRLRAGADLKSPPFRRYEARISSPTSYEDSQRLGADLRAARVDGFLYASARAPGGVNVGLLEPAFAARRPRRFETWICSADRSKVELARRSISRVHPGERLAFAREEFLVAGRLPSPAT